jgi:FtsZ-interacting cell division protein ZipA
LEILEQIGGALALALFIGLWAWRKQRKEAKREAAKQVDRERDAEAIARAQARLDEERRAN